MDKTEVPGLDLWMDFAPFPRREVYDVEEAVERLRFAYSADQRAGRRLDPYHARLIINVASLLNQVSLHVFMTRQHEDVLPLPPTNG